MAFQEKQLAQARENSTNAVSVYSPAASTTGIIKSITVCNQTAGAVTYRIFLDDDGTTFDESTALYFDIALPANTTDLLDVHWGMDNSSGNLAYRSNTANAITITVFGVEVT